MSARMSEYISESIPGEIALQKKIPQENPGQIPLRISRKNPEGLKKK